MKGITQRKDSGKFVAHVSISRPKGKHINVTVPGRFASESEALAARTQFIANLF